MSPLTAIWVMIADVAAFWWRVSPRLPKPPPKSQAFTADPWCIENHKLVDTKKASPPLVRHSPRCKNVRGMGRSGLSTRCAARERFMVRTRPQPPTPIERTFTDVFLQATKSYLEILRLPPHPRAPAVHHRCTRGRGYFAAGQPSPIGPRPESGQYLDPTII